MPAPTPTVRPFSEIEADCYDARALTCALTCLMTYAATNDLTCLMTYAATNDLTGPDVDAASCIAHKAHHAAQRLVADFEALHAAGAIDFARDMHPSALADESLPR